MFEIALEGNELFQKFLAKKIKRECLLEFVLSTGEVVEGFVTGLDDQWIQVTQKSDLEAVLLNIDTVVSVNSTGKTTRDLSPTDRERVRNFSFAITQVCNNKLAELNS